MEDLVLWLFASLKHRNVFGMVSACFELPTHYSKEGNSHEQQSFWAWVLESLKIKISGGGDLHCLVTKQGAAVCAWSTSGKKIVIA